MEVVALSEERTNIHGHFIDPTPQSYPQVILPG
jgi:hypothetical protein